MRRPTALSYRQRSVRRYPTITADNATSSLSIELDEPWPDLLNRLSVSATGIVCPAGLDDLEGLAAGTAKGAESGPYVLDSSEPGVRYNYSLREEYTAWPEWSEVQGSPAANLEFVMSPDTSATTNLVLDSQLDIARVMPESTDRFNTDDGYNISAFPFGDFFIISTSAKAVPL